MKRCLLLRIFIATSLTLPSVRILADVDGWDYSGQNARNESLQTSYVNLYDSYNIWVNPAYANKYNNRVDANVAEGGRDDESAGVYFKKGISTWGFYVGRPSDSSLALSIGGSGFRQVSEFAITGVSEASTLSNNLNPLNIESPRSQFDVFWGMELASL